MPLSDRLKAHFVPLENSKPKFMLFIMIIAISVDSMLHIVSIPIIPKYVRSVGSWVTHLEGGSHVKYTQNYTATYTNATGVFNQTRTHTSHKMVGQIVVYKGEETGLGILFASKAITQIIISPTSGVLIDKFCYSIPLIVGLLMTFSSSVVFACGHSYNVFLTARCLHGAGSTFVITVCFAMLAKTYRVTSDRTRYFGMILAFVSVGHLVGRCLGNMLYEFTGKEGTFSVLASMSLFSALVTVLLVLRPIPNQRRELDHEREQMSAPVHQLFVNPYILCSAGTLIISSLLPAFLEPTLGVWLIDTMYVPNWNLGVLWMAAYFLNIVGTVITIRLANSFANEHWIIAIIGLILQGMSCIILLFCSHMWVAMIFVCTLYVGLALVVTIILPIFGSLVEQRGIRFYGYVYAIAQMAFNLPYAVAPMTAGKGVEAVGFTYLIAGLATITLLYSPLLYFLRNAHFSRVFEESPQDCNALEVSSRKSKQNCPIDDESND